MASIEDTPCPACGEKKLAITMRVRVKPLGTFSLPGAQLKFPGIRWPYLMCEGCGVSAPAKPARDDL